ncbi:uncharacterized protein LOC126576566 [Anopheles aquasalis]|uniref:uncharacterized protein LOC126576566 n=1 Tax=Anopheles aquasalis TaxID=42839 RepID=UPI00215A3E72|nr:uncharacterized protein LOC126576566 [Anopheles aquasalis]
MVTCREVIVIAGKMQQHKSPGPDGIPNQPVKSAIRRYPEVFRQLFQRLLDEGSYPDQWKEQRLVLIPKPGRKPPGLPSSYRPLCMLNTLVKVFERIVLNRLQENLEKVPAGPHLSPTLWNVAYDDVLGATQPGPTQNLAIADDLVVLAAAKKPHHLAAKSVKEEVQRIQSWMEHQSLKLGPNEDGSNRHQPGEEGQPAHNAQRRCEHSEDGYDAQIPWRSNQ